MQLIRMMIIIEREKKNYLNGKAFENLFRKIHAQHLSIPLKIIIKFELYSFPYIRLVYILCENVRDFSN